MEASRLLNEQMKTRREERLRAAAAAGDFEPFNMCYPGLSDRFRAASFTFDKNTCEGLYLFARHRRTALEQYGIPAQMYMREAEARVLKDHLSVRKETSNSLATKV